MGDFIKAHHQKAERREVAAFAADYADRVQFLNDGTVNRDFIAQKTSDYHAGLSQVKEEVSKYLGILPLGRHRYEVRYQLRSTTTSRKDNKQTVRDVPLVLEVEVVNGVPRIVKQVAEKSSR